MYATARADATVRERWADSSGRRRNTLPVRQHKFVVAGADQLSLRPRWDAHFQCPNGEIAYLGLVCQRAVERLGKYSLRVRLYGSRSWSARPPTSRSTRMASLSPQTLTTRSHRAAQ